MGTCRAGAKNRVNTGSVAPAADQASMTSLAPLAPLSLSMVTILMSCCGPANADEAADVLSQNSGILGYTNGGLVIAFSPIVIYGVFYLYRAAINPKAKLQDLLFVAAFCVVVANIVSIAVFHTRVY
jgi:hypothetical protein